jgi:hypothetical protein
MPRKPIFETSRAQSTAVALATGLVLLGATGLAYVQARSGSGYNTPDDRVQRLAQPSAVGPQRSILIDLPVNWRTVESEPGRFVSSDPDKPARRLIFMSGSLNEQATPALSAKQFLEQQLDPSARKTFRPETEPMGFALANRGLFGVQLIGTSDGGQGRTREHMLACLTSDGRQFWWIYLTDTVEAGEDVQASLRANTLLLEQIYRSARVSQE